MVMSRRHDQRPEADPKAGIAQYEPELGADQRRDLMVPSQAARKKPGNEPDQDRDRAGEQDSGPMEPAQGEALVEKRRPDADGCDQRQRCRSQRTGGPAIDRLEITFGSPHEPAGTEQGVADDHRNAA